MLLLRFCAEFIDFILGSYVRPNQLFVHQNWLSVFEVIRLKILFHISKMQSSLEDVEDVSKLFATSCLMYTACDGKGGVFTEEEQKMIG